MKIAILGSHPASAGVAPFQDKTYDEFIGGKVLRYPRPRFMDEKWTIWGCSPGCFGIAQRADAWFEVHRWEPGQQWFSPEYVQFLQEFRGAVYTGGVIPEIDNHVVYPLTQVEAEFSSLFLTSSLSLMAALAILTLDHLRALRAVKREGGDIDASHHSHWLQAMKVKLDPSEIDKADTDDEIGWFGVDMSANEEYSRQKPGAWFFGLEMLRRGIGMYYPPESDLFCPEPVYGISEWNADYIKQTTRMREFNAKLSADQNLLQQLTQQIAANAGAKDDLAYQIKTWMNHWRIPAGVTVRLAPGTGLGCGVNTVDGKPTG